MSRDNRDVLSDSMTFGEALIASMKEAVAFKGGKLALRTRVVGPIRDASPASQRGDLRRHADANQGGTAMIAKEQQRLAIGDALYERLGKPLEA